MNTPHPYDLVIGLDRSDKKADLHLITTATGQRRSQTIDTAPEALWEWLLQLRQEQPQARVGLCLEQPAVHLIAFLESYEWIMLYPINPITLQKFREAFVTSRAKDALYLAELLLTHHDQLQPWAPEDSATRAVQQLVFHRRAVVDERTALTNRLIALLKQYFPQALVLCGEDLWRPLATRFLLKWSSLQAVQKAKPATLKQFYYLNGSRSAKRLEQRLALVEKAVPVTDETALIEALRSGRLRGAGLDVFAKEPLSPESPLWSMPNVLITPHVSAVSPAYWRRETDLIVENLRRYIEGRELLNVVRKDRGY